MVWRPLSSKKTQAGPLLSIIIQIWNGPETKNRQHLVTSFKKPHSISQVMHLGKSLAVFWSIVCIFSCVYVCSYTSTYGYYTFPLAVTAQDAMRTVSWGSVYWNSPNSSIELFHLKMKPQRCNILPPPPSIKLSLSLSLCPLCWDCKHVSRQCSCILGSELRFSKSMSTVWLSCLFVPHSSLKRIYNFQLLNVTCLCLCYAPLCYCQDSDN